MLVSASYDDTINVYLPDEQEDFEWYTFIDISCLTVCWSIFHETNELSILNINF